MSWTKVQSKVGTISSAPTTTVAATFTGSVTVGNLIVVSASSYPDGTPTSASISDTHNTYVSQALLLETAAPYIQIFTSVATTGGTVTVTATVPGGYPVLVIEEWSFTAGTVYYGVPVTAAGTSATPSAGSLIISNTPCLVLGAIATEATTFSNSGLTVADSSAYVSGLSLGIAVGSDANVSASTVTCSLGQGSSTPWAAAALAIFSSGDGMIPPGLGCKLVTDRLAVITVLPAVGGTQPITSYSLARGPHGGGLTTVATLTAGLPYTNTGLSASTSYDYQLTATDSGSHTVVTPILTVTTRATESITPPTLTAGSITSWINGTVPLDTSGNPLQLHGGNVFWSPRYNMYFGCGQLIDASHGPLTMPETVYVYGSTDLMNWTRLDSGGAWDNTINSVTYGSMLNRPKIIEDPTDGNYYGSCVCSASGSTGPLLALSASVPWGPYVYCGTLVSSTDSDSSIFVDYDGSRWAVTVASITLLSVSVGWSSVAATYTTSSDTEGPAPFRHGNNLYVFTEVPSDWPPVADVALLMPLSTQYGVSPFTLAANCTTISNATIFTTAGEALAAPAGAVSPYGWSGGTGIDPTLSYSSQSGAVLQTVTGQYIALQDRWEPGAGLGVGLCTYVWLPFTFDGSGNPLIPFVSSFTPSAQPAAGGGSFFGGSQSVFRARQRPPLSGPQVTQLYG